MIQEQAAVASTERPLLLKARVQIIYICSSSFIQFGIQLPLEQLRQLGYFYCAGYFRIYIEKK